MKLRKFLLAAMVCALCVGQASALEFSYDAPEGYLFGRPTSSSQAAYPSLHPTDEAHSFRCSSSSDCNRYAGLQSETESLNVDRSKNTALIPPGFGTPTSYLPGSGEALTPNLIPGALSGGLVNQVGSVSYPTLDTVTQAPSLDSNFSYTTQPSQSQTVGFTDVTDDLRYSNGSLGTLKIPAIGLSVKVYEGTDSKTLAKGAGHFTDTSIWDGNCCFAAHNRGVNNYFGKIHTLETGDIITLTTKLGTRNYAVTSVEKVSETDTSGLASTANNQITLYTCVRDQSAYRWRVTAVQQ